MIATDTGVILKQIVVWAPIDSAFDVSAGRFGDFKTQEYKRWARRSSRRSPGC